jgi:hypothetical protein
MSGEMRRLVLAQILVRNAPTEYLKRIGVSEHLWHVGRGEEADAVDRGDGPAVAAVPPADAGDEPGGAGTSTRARLCSCTLSRWSRKCRAAYLRSPFSPASTKNRLLAGYGGRTST